MPWVKGQSGNPRGAGAHAAAKMNRAAALSTKAWDHYDDVLTGRVAATVAEKTAVAKDVLDRHLGKPKISGEFKIEHSSAAHLQIMSQLVDEMKDRLGPARPETTKEIIDLTPIQDKQSISHQPILEQDQGLGPAKAPAKARPIDPPGGQGTPGGGL